MNPERRPEPLTGVKDFDQDLFVRLSALPVKRRASTTMIFAMNDILICFKRAIEQHMGYGDMENLDRTLCSFFLLPKVLFAYEKHPEYSEIDILKHKILTNQMGDLLDAALERANAFASINGDTNPDDVRNQGDSDDEEDWYEPSPMQGVEGGHTNRAAPSHQKCSHALSHLAYSKGCRRLNQVLETPRTVETRQKFIALQPKGDRITAIPSKEMYLKQLQRGTIRTAIQTAEPFTAEGLSGWTVDHFKQLVRNQRQTPLLDILSMIEYIMTNGKLSHTTTSSWVLRAAMGVAIPKAGKNIEIADRMRFDPDAPIRPLAVGDAVRRIVLRARLRHIGGKKIRSATGHDQTGVSVSAGAEIASFRLKLRLRVQEMLPEEGELGLVSCDVTNAFQNMYRNHLVDAVATRCPELLGHAKFLYSMPCIVVLSPNTRRDVDGSLEDQTAQVESTRGVHQGCPLGPVLFAIGL